MINIHWNEITMGDKDLIDSYYQREQCRSCEYTFSNNILWKPHYDIKYAIISEMLVFIINTTDSCSVSYPIGKNSVKEAIEVLLEYFKSQDKLFRMHMVTKEQFELLDVTFPDKFQIEYDRDVADYIYESEKLISLSGKKLHSKRNHLNRFRAENEGRWLYERISQENKEDCLRMAEEWRKMNDCDDDPDKYAEFCVTLNALKNMDELGLSGGLIRLDGRVIAFSLGEKLCDDTFVVHIEKAYSDVRGAYPIINQQFALDQAENYKYINREEDTGSEGLRKAKLSYYPAFLQEKGVVTLKEYK